ncbi:MAG: LacI family DNA-binding transcriptional regulator [Lachnospiraceae bacterium]
MNIYDVARMAGVSIATVSRVVNDSPLVSEKTKERVTKIIEESGYTPNVFARGLGLDSMKTIGIMCPDISDEYMARAVANLEANLHKYQYDCILYCSGYHQEEKEKSVRLLLEKRIDALILVGSTYAGTGQNTKELDYIHAAAEKAPVFVINGKISGENIYCAYCDDKSIMYEVTTELIRSGRKRILFMTDSRSYSARQKLEGYEQALRDAGYPVIDELKIRTKNRIPYVRDTLMERSSLDFDSVVATDDGIAVGAIKYAQAKKIRIPEDLSIVGYNNSALSIGCTPELTTVDNRLEKLCDQTIKNMIRLLLKHEMIETDTKVSGDIVKRCTTDF